MAEHELMRPNEVAARFGVDPRTLARWARGGRIRCIITLGGHRRYYREDVARLLEGEDEAA